jgi:hypothetical protein
MKTKFFCGAWSSFFTSWAFLSSPVWVDFSGTLSSACQHLKNLARSMVFKEICHAFQKKDQFYFLGCFMLHDFFQFHPKRFGRTCTKAFLPGSFFKIVL